jgi:hypothetical protein
MAEKKKPKDRHASGFLIRLPERYRETFEQVKRQTRRPYTVEAQLAIDSHFRFLGLVVPGGK